MTFVHEICFTSVLTKYFVCLSAGVSNKFWQTITRISIYIYCTLEFDSADFCIITIVRVREKIIQFRFFLIVSIVSMKSFKNTLKIETAPN